MTNVGLKYLSELDSKLIFIDLQIQHVHLEAQDLGIYFFLTLMSRELLIGIWHWQISSSTTKTKTSNFFCVFVSTFQSIQIFPIL